MVLNSGSARKNLFTLGIFLLRSSSVAEQWVEKYYGGRYLGDELAKQGYVCLATDALNWSDRGGGGFEGQQALASNLMHLGMSLAGLIAHEDLRAAEFLASLPEVDSDRVASLWALDGFLSRLAGGGNVGPHRRWCCDLLDGNRQGPHAARQQSDEGPLCLHDVASWIVEPAETIRISLAWPAPNRCSFTMAVKTPCFQCRVSRKLIGSYIPCGVRNDMRNFWRLGCGTCRMFSTWKCKTKPSNGSIDNSSL